MLSVRNAAVVTAKRMVQSTSNRPKVTKRIPNGCVFAPLQSGNRIAFNHPLDDDAEYRRFLKKDFLEECGHLVHKYPGYKDYMISMLDYTVPYFHTCWTFGPELVYKFVAPKEHQTLENKWKCKLLRVCVDLLFSSLAVIDDINDRSDERMGKPSWKMVSPGGVSTVILDGQQLDTLPHILLKKHFRDSPGYSLLLETVSEATMDVVIGQTLDILSQNSKEGLTAYASSAEIARGKAGSFLRIQPIFGLLHAGILDEELLRKSEQLFSETGILLQDWDDFCDYYCTPSQMGKPSNDAKNAVNTWASTIAMENFSEDETNTFKECYGSEDPEKREVVHQLYNKINLPHLYIEYMNEKHLECNRMVKDLQHKALEEACYSWLQWLLGDEFKCQ